MSIRPGATILPRASMVSAASPLMSASTAAILPAMIATSRTASSPTDGSITRPPLMMRSYAAADALPTQASDAADVQRNWRLFIMVLPFPNIDDGCNFYHKVRAERVLTTQAGIAVRVRPPSREHWHISTLAMVEPRAVRHGPGTGSFFGHCRGAASPCPQGRCRGPSDREMVSSYASSQQ